MHFCKSTNVNCTVTKNNFLQNKIINPNTLKKKLWRRINPKTEPNKDKLQMEKNEFSKLLNLSSKIHRCTVKNHTMMENRDTL